MRARGFLIMAEMRACRPLSGRQGAGQQSASSHGINRIETESQASSNSQILKKRDTFTPCMKKVGPQECKLDSGLFIYGHLPIWQDLSVLLVRKMGTFFNPSSYPQCGRHLWMVPVVNETESSRDPHLPASLHFSLAHLIAITSFHREAFSHSVDTTCTILHLLLPLHSSNAASEEEDKSDDEDERAMSFLRLFARLLARSRTRRFSATAAENR